MSKSIYSALMIMALIGSNAAWAHDPISLKSKKNQVSDIKDAQRFLHDLNDKSGHPYYSGSDDGVFSPQLEASIKQFQIEKGILTKNAANLGLLGPSTWKQLETDHDAFVASTKKPAEPVTPVAETKPAETKPTTEAKPEETFVAGKQVLSLDHLKDQNITISFDGDSIRANGSLPEACAKRLRFTDLKETAPDSESTSTAPTTLEEVAASARKVGVQVVFDASEEEKSLDACVEKHKSEAKVALKDRNSLFKSYYGYGKPAVLGILNDSGDFVQSEPRSVNSSFAKLESYVNSKDCDDCQLKSISGLNLDWVKSTRESLNSSLVKKDRTEIEESIKKKIEAISSAKSLAELKRLLSDLSALADSANKLKISTSDKAALMGAIADGMVALVEASEKIAPEDQKACSSKKTTRSFFGSGGCTDESAHADFIASVYAKVEKLPGLDDAGKSEARRLADSYAEGGSERLKFISKIDPSNPEILDALNNGQADLRTLSMNVQKQCAFVVNQENFLRCNQARQEYSTAAQSLQDLSKVYTDSQMQMASANQYSPYPKMDWMNGTGGFAPFSSAQYDFTTPNSANSYFAFQGQNSVPGQNSALSGGQSGGQFQKQGGQVGSTHGGPVYAIPLSGGFNNGFNTAMNPSFQPMNRMTQ